MHSLKTARPLLTSVAYFVLFAMILFSIIDVQAFKGSLRRACYLSLTLGEDEIQINDQFCGGYINPDTLNITNYIQLDGTPGTTIKGYICPIGQEQDNPQNNMESFDMMYYVALQVIIVASANGWSPLMYSMIDSEFFISCLFFIICIIILNFWLANLFVAVITNTFSAIRKETKTSAFGAGTYVMICLTCCRRVLKSVPEQNNSLTSKMMVGLLQMVARVILEVPRMRPLLLTVFGNMYGLLNMTLFLILINYIAALVSVQLLCGDYNSDETANFANLFNAFLNCGSAEDASGQTAVVVIFICAWMLFANFIVLQMFIAVINENFDVAVIRRLRVHT
ncbi:uncharacterized protein ARMOST_15798 [Armillaria ostoyae]|uniref:Ion transport domain-containing protein n=1 Tax=Armillaria ostoyae TaxID=47428 RepID=A0A284RUG9_ARMOS|nr:uncharacterized protein ARMOST_15798 [Armillaria ostoyae]